MPYNRKMTPPKPSPSEVLSVEELRELSVPSAFRSWAAIGGDWALVAGIFALAVRFPFWWTYAAGMVLMARQQLALALLMHDGAHGRLFESRVLNDHVAQFFCAGPVFLPLSTYKRGHLQHHKDPLTPGDPDIILIGGYPAPARKLIKKLAQDLCGLSYYKFLKFFIYMAKRQRRSAARGSSASGSDEKLSRAFVRFSIMAPNAALFAVLAWAGHPWLFFLLWTIPSMTILQGLLRVRALSEHAGLQPGPDQSLNARTVTSPIQAFFIAPHDANYHIEHHLYVSVPFFRLRELHRVLNSRGALPKDNVFTSYAPVMASLVH
jgi:fatty acid desaturase